MIPHFPICLEWSVPCSGERWNPQLSREEWQQRPSSWAQPLRRLSLHPSLSLLWAKLLHPANSKRQTRDRHCSPSSFKHWGGSCWEQHLDAPAANTSEMEGSTREWDYQCSAKYNPSLLNDWHFLALKLWQSSLWGSKHGNNSRIPLCMGLGRKCQDFSIWLTGKLTCLTKTACSLVVHGNN